MSRPALVLLHAFGASAKAWDRVIDQLGGRFEVVALDLPGFGGSSDDLQATSVHDYAGWVLAQIAQRGVRCFVLVGWSMGAKIALAAALQRPNGLEAIILVAPSPPGPEPMTPDQRQAERDAFDDPQAAHEALKTVAGDDFDGPPLDAAVSDRMAATPSAWGFWLDVGSKEDLSKAVGELHLPIIVITGDQDGHLGPIAATEHVTPKLHNVEHRIIAGSGHLIPHEAPEALAAEIVAGLAQGRS